MSLDQPMDDRPSTSRLWWGVLFVALGTLAWHAWHVYPWALDDAYISFRYAENFANGHGFVYNPGERVEGYTTFLWVFLLGIGAKVGFDLEMFARAAGVFFAAGCILLLFLAHRFTPLIRREEGALAALFLGTTGYFTAWSVCMMEVPLVGFLSLLAMLLYFSSLHRAESGGRWMLAGVVAALAGMSRPEVVLLFVVLGIERLVAFVRVRDRSVAWYAIGFFALGLPYFLWRVWYYQSFLPNTFHAKVGYTVPQVVRGLRYTFDFLSVSVLLVAPVLWFHARGCVAWERRSRLGLVGVFLAIIVVYVVAVGGDVMAAFRFHAPFAPLLCLMAGIGVWRMGSKRGRFGLSVLIVVYGLLVSLYSVPVAERVEQETVTPLGVVVGKWMRLNLDEDALIATNTAGTIPFFSKLRTVDMLGLNDRVIARAEIPDMGSGIAGHEKGAGRYVLSRDPDYIHFHSSLGLDQPAFRSDREIWAEGEFHENYVLRRYTVKGEWPPLQLFVHRRRIPSVYPTSRGNLPAFDWMNDRWTANRPVVWPDDTGSAFRLIPPHRVPNNLPRGWAYHSSFDDRAPDLPTGELLSEPFLVGPGEVLLFWVGGDYSSESAVELVGGGEVIVSRRGNGVDTLEPMVLDLRPHEGKELQVRLVDGRTGSMGRLHAGGFFIATAGDSSPEASAEQE